MNAMFTVDFEPVGKRVEVKAGMTLLEAARLAGLPLTTDCGGYGSCGQCEVIVREQKFLGKPNSTEISELSAEKLALGFRLACQAEVFGAIKIDIPGSSLIAGQRLQVESGTDGYILPGSFADRVVQSYLVTVAEPSLQDGRGDLERLRDALQSEHNCGPLFAHPAVVRSLPPLLRANNWQVKAVVRGDHIVGFLAPDARMAGLAVDLGTTKVAAFLLDLVTGETLAVEGRPNPQIGYGEDVISRLVYAMNKPEGARTLAQAVQTALAELAQVLAERAGLSSAQIAETVIVGNMAMIHLLLELPVSQLALAPYVSAASAAQETRAVEMGLPFLSDGRVYIPPCVSGFVGADLVAMALASGIGQDDRTLLGIDIGTNTEIILSQKGTPRLLSLSCASGPAFEGAHIRFGMRAAAGAIERVRLGGDAAVVKTIDDAPAVGICGSGIIDAVAELRRVGIVNARGRLLADRPGVRLGSSGLEYVLVPGGESGIGEDITVTQHDIEEIQFAKGAILAGIIVLLEVAGLKPADLDEVILAGAFGTYLNLDTAISLGLLPDLPLDHYRQVGNAAGDGSRRILVSQTERAAASEIARRIDYVDLSIYPGFRRIYAKSMSLNG